MTKQFKKYHHIHRATGSHTPEYCFLLFAILVCLSALSAFGESAKSSLLRSATALDYHPYSITIGVSGGDSMGHPLGVMGGGTTSTTNGINGGGDDTSTGEPLGGSNDDHSHNPGDHHSDGPPSSSDHHMFNG
ncbi:MAG: hypothetical protein KDD55_10050 [Bdellovibrionales bacterium]|nr:hypothetical protein [Bdellovibrionales bacterium]